MRWLDAVVAEPFADEELDEGHILIIRRDVVEHQQSEAFRGTVPTAGLTITGQESIFIGIDIDYVRRPHSRMQLGKTLQFPALRGD